MNIKTFAVVKCWVMNKHSTPRASSSAGAALGVPGGLAAVPRGDAGNAT